MLQNISIHAPREGCDGQQRTAHNGGQISIHAPREGCDSKNGKKASEIPAHFCTNKTKTRENK
jgi:hypothetical protein